MKLSLQKKGASTAAMLAMSIAYLGLAPQAEAGVTWLAEDVGGDLVLKTDGGSLAWAAKTRSLRPAREDIILATWDDYSGRLVSRFFASARGGARFEASAAGTHTLALPGLLDLSSAWWPGGVTVTGDAFGFWGPSGRNLLLPLTAGSVGSTSGVVSPVTTVTVPGASVASVFGSNLDAGPVVIWTGNLGGANTISIALTSYVTPVDIDIKPGSPENTVNLGSKGVTQVAILGSVDFDATEVDPLTVELADATVRVKGKKGRAQATIQDTNGDGFLDLVLHMETEGFTLTDGDVTATLTGTTFEGEDIEGEDVVRVVPKS